MTLYVSQDNTGTRAYASHHQGVVIGGVWRPATTLEYSEIISNYVVPTWPNTVAISPEFLIPQSTPTQTWANPLASLQPSPLVEPSSSDLDKNWVDWCVVVLKDYDYEDDAFARCYDELVTSRSWTVSKFEKHWDAAKEEFMKKTPKETKPYLERTFKEAFPNLKMKVVKGEIGLEIEAEGENLFRSPIQYWSAISDGSLREVNGHPPIEYVLRSPIDREEVLPALEYLTERLRMAKSKLVMSHRCSVHVHINIQQMKMIDLFKFICLYVIFEDLLVGWSGPERKGNLFCLRAKDALFQIELLTAALKEDRFNGVFDKEMRYSAMNTASMGTHGSLEFRSMKGTVDIETIANWVKTLTALKDIAESDTFKNASSISRMFQSLGPERFFERVLKQKIPLKVYKELQKQDSFSQLLWDGFRTMRDLSYCIDWDEPPMWMKEKRSGTGSRKRKVEYTPHNEDEYVSEDDE